MNRRGKGKGNMSDTRQKAKKFLIDTMGKLPAGILCTSKLYEPNESWTKSPAWWIEIPITKLRSGKYSKVHILCSKRDSGFHYLDVPISYFMDKIDKLILREDGKLSLFLSARSEDRFVDLRGLGRIDFSNWLKL